MPGKSSRKAQIYTKKPGQNRHKTKVRQINGDYSKEHQDKLSQPIQRPRNELTRLAGALTCLTRTELHWFSRGSCAWCLQMTCASIMALHASQPSIPPKAIKNQLNPPLQLVSQEALEKNTEMKQFRSVPQLWEWTHFVISSIFLYNFQGTLWRTKKMGSFLYGENIYVRPPTNDLKKRPKPALKWDRMLDKWVHF